MSIDHAGVPSYEEVAGQLRAQIVIGVLPPGTKLPSEAELIRQYDVSRVTARAVVRTLLHEGLIEVRQGKGAIVRNTLGTPTRTEPRELRRTDGGYVDTSVAAGMILVREPARHLGSASARIAPDLGVPADAPVYVYERLLTDASNWRLSHCLYLPVATCADVPALDDAPYREPTDLYAVLSAASYRLRWVETVMARTPSPDLAAELCIPTGTAMLTTHRRTVDADTGRVLAMEELRINADDTRLAFKL